MVVDRNRKAVVLTGFVERNAINQAIADARRNTHRGAASRTPTSASSTRPARTSTSASTASTLPATRGQVKPASRRFERLMAAYRAGFASLKAPAQVQAASSARSTVVLAKGENFAAALRSGNFATMDAAYTALLASGARPRPQVRGRRRHHLRLEPQELAPLPA